MAVNKLKKKNVTYLLGAGASFYSCPIQDQLGEKMRQAANLYLGYVGNSKEVFTDEFMPDTFKAKYEDKDEVTLELAYSMGFHGYISSKFGTIDTYAKKLYLNKSTLELERLKTAVSAFFTLWQLSEDKTLKKFDTKGTNYENIDPRYIQLMAAVLEERDGSILIPEHVNFVSWNYDLQLEQAFREFNAERNTWGTLSQSLAFSPYSKHGKMNICHLNGYHGYHSTRKAEGEKNKEETVLDKIQKETASSDNPLLELVAHEISGNEKQFISHISYAWERGTNTKTQHALNNAVRIFQQTEILVVVGYSFPNFNKNTDFELFKRLQKGTKIVIHDPEANKLQVKQLLNKGINPDIFDIEEYKKKEGPFYMPIEL